MTVSSSTVRILCVDDDAATLDGLRELLARWGFRVLGRRFARGGTGARRHGYDIVLADYHLQNRPAGLKLLVKLVRHAPGGQRRTGALLTADATEKLVREADELGFPVLRKPMGEPRCARWSGAGRPASTRANRGSSTDRRRELM